MKTNEMHTFFINDLIQLYCLWYVLNKQVFIVRKTCTCSFMVYFPASMSGHRPDCLYGCMKKYRKTACTGLPGDEQLVVW